MQPQILSRRTSMTETEYIIGQVSNNLEHQCRQNWLTLIIKQADNHILFGCHKSSSEI
jgi:hypothetical protein